jgi:hypothetical protein
MSDDPPTTLTAAGIADHVRQALEAGDLDMIAAYLSPDVHWGPPGDANPPCRNRQQVLSWYARGRASGRRATVTGIEVYADALLVELLVDGASPRWQVLRVGPDGINDIRGFEDRAGAAAELGV